MVSSLQMEQPVSRTDQYKRVMKPLLERKRRARINRCLDELRDLLVAALQAEGETVTRLEKADILELTVRHVRRLNQRRRLTLPPPGSSANDPQQDAVKFQQGFLAAAQQVQSFLLSTPSLEPAASSRLLVHLSTCATAITNRPPSPNFQSPSREQPAMTSTQSSRGPPMASSPMLSPSSAASPPPLIDLSVKSIHPQYPMPNIRQQPRIIAPTPIRKEPVVFKDPYPVGPQDLSIRRCPTPENDSKDAWRPW